MASLSKFAERLNEIIQENKINPTILSNQINISHATICSWLRGSSIPSLSNLILLADYFNLTIEFLSGRTDNNYFYPQNVTIPFSQRLRDIINKKNLSDYKFSKESKIPRNTLHYWLKGYSEPLMDNLIKLANYLDYTIDFLIGREN